jgi:hypothetical protein
MPIRYARIAFEAHHTATGRLITNVMHAEVDAVANTPNWQTIANEIATWLSNDYLAVLTTHDTYDQIVVSEETYPASAFGQGVFVAGAPGSRTAADENLSPAICLLASYKTQTAKRYARGHTFMPPALSSSTLGSSGTFLNSSTYWTTSTTFMNAYLAGHGGSEAAYTPIVFSRTRVLQNQTVFTYPIVAGQLRTAQHFLRSRITAP